MAARTPVSARLTDEEMRLIRKRDRERTEVLAVADRHVLLRHMDAQDADPEGLTDEALAEIQSRVDRAAHSREDVEALLHEVHRFKALLPIRP